MPDDVVRKTFGKARLRGYETTEVDAFLEEVVDELRRLNRELDQARAVQDSHIGRNAGGGRHLTVTEQEELDHIRRERADLVADMAKLQKLYDRLKRAVRELQSQSAS